MIRLLAVLLVIAAPAYAESARVLSGEHGDFTRLVIELPDQVDWNVGRTADGYAFAPKTREPTSFDLSSAWQRIGRTRLKSLSTNPVSGVLELTLGCDCHVFPFEYQPGVVVLDIKPGPPPPGSVFEASFTKPELPSPLTTKGSPASEYNWLSDFPKSAAQQPVTTLPFPLATGEVSLDPLRVALLEQIARGAADGIVDMRLPSSQKTSPGSILDSLPWSSVRLGEDQGIAVKLPNSVSDGKSPAVSCAADDLLDVASWGADQSPMDLLAASRSGIYGEFDVADPEAVLHAIRLQLYLGFGAEARQLSDVLMAGQADDTLELYRSMAMLVDGNSDPDTPFATMLDCNGPAALWAALAHDRLPPGPGVNTDAILRAYLALPSHLRRYLGGPLAERLLARGDTDAARVIRDTIERSPQSDASKVALLDAQSDLSQGDADAAIAHAETAVSLNGNDPESLVALVEAHFRKLEPVGLEITDSLLALRGETAGTGNAAGVDRAIVLALALSNQTDAAFLDAGAEGATLADLWRVVAERATDDDFLRHAVLPTGGHPPAVETGVDLAVAKRLTGLGFTDAALIWMGPVQPSDTAERRLLAASAEVSRGDAKAALGLLGDLSDEPSAALRARALIQLGDLQAAGSALSSAGLEEEFVRTDIWQENWANLDPSAAEPWKLAAKQVDGLPVESDLGLLGRSAAVLDASAASRSAIEALLTSVASPGGS